MNKTNTYSFLITSMLSGFSQTALGNLNGDNQMSDDLSEITSSVDLAQVWDSFTSYSYNELSESNSSINYSDVVDFDIIMRFAKTLTENMKVVDPDIQRIVDEHFWEIL